MDQIISRLRTIGIQTVSYCNSGCIVCPWTSIKDSVPKQSMSNNIWNKALEGITVFNPEMIMPYMNNEPLLDKNIESRIRDLRSVSPQALIELSTNGILLNGKSSGFLVNNVDIILISLFGYDEISNLRIMGKGMSYERIKNNILNLRKEKEATGSKSIINIIKLINNPFMSNDVVFRDRSFWEKEGIHIRYYYFVDRSTNTGDFKQRDNRIKLYGCDFNRHKESTYISYNGDISFCCHDWRSKYIMGNLNENSLFDIINGEKFNRIREMVDGVTDSGDHFLCKTCFHCKTSYNDHLQTRPASQY